MTPPARSRGRWRRLILPLALALPVLALLVGLGSWQVQRLAWKTALLEELAAAQAAPPTPATAATEPFAHITATGRLRREPIAFAGLEVRGNALGGGLIAVLDRPGAAPLLIERGWAPFDGGAIAWPEGEVTLTGFARPSERRSPLAAADDLERRRFLTFDVAAIARSLGVSEALPFALTVIEPGPPAAPSGLGLAPPPPRSTLPDPARGFPAPNNPHLGYAITWFGLAAAWMAVFALWARRRMREA